MLSTYATPSQPTPPLPLRTDSLSTGIPKQTKLTTPLAQCKEDAKHARILLTASVTNDDDNSLELAGEDRVRRHEERTRELTDMLDRMTGWVEELATLLQQAYKNQTELETSLTLARSNLQLALANNEMLEEALKRGGGGGQDVGWRRWSEREGVRRSGSVKEYVQPDRPNSVQGVSRPTSPPPQQQPPSGPSRFFSFKSSLQRMSSTNTSPTATSTPPPYASLPPSASASTSSLLPPVTIPSSPRNQSRAASPAPLVAATATPDPSSSRTPSPSPSPMYTIPAMSHSHSTSRSVSIESTPRERELTSLLNKERAALKTLGDAKAQLEDELESLSQALFEEANKMVSIANRKLAETEEELRIAMEQKEALRGALRIVEGENGTLREVGGSERDAERSEVDNDAKATDEQQVTGLDVEQVQEYEKSTDASRLDGNKINVPSNLQTSQSHSTPPARSLHTQSHGRPSIPAVKVSEQRSAIPDDKRSFWSPVAPLTDAGEGEDQGTPTSSSRSLLYSPVPSSDKSPAPVEALTRAPPARGESLNPDKSSPASTTQPTQAGAPIHRWSILPVTPTSRHAVRSEFENALRRMRELVGEGEEDETGNGGVTGDGEDSERAGEGTYLGKDKGDVESARAGGSVNPWRT